jgi:chromosome partitioning protein
VNKPPEQARRKVPVVSLISPKGGVGKTTAATLLASMLCTHLRVAIINADAQESVARWAKGLAKERQVTIFNDRVTDDTIIDLIEAAKAEHDFVIVDVQGTANLMAGYAISSSNLVIIPTQASALDAADGVQKALTLIKNQERVMKREVNYRVLFNRVSAAIMTKGQAALYAELRQRGVAVMECKLQDREAYRAMFSWGETLVHLPNDAVYGIEPARSNAAAFAKEVVDCLTGQKNRSEEK